jgi:hypothetical protein
MSKPDGMPARSAAARRKSVARNLTSLGPGTLMSKVAATLRTNNDWPLSSSLRVAGAAGVGLDGMVLLDW